MDFFKCPECGYSLSLDVAKDKRGKFRLEFYCEGGGDDRFSFEIATNLSNRDIAKLKVRKTEKKQMSVQLLERHKDTTFENLEE